MLCEYGCGQEAKFPPRKGRSKWCCSDKYQHCPSFRKRVYSKERNDKIKKSKLESWNDPNHVYNSLDYKKKHKDGFDKFRNDSIKFEEAKQKVSKSVKKLWLNLEYKQRQKDIHKISMNKPEVLKKTSERNKKLWEDPDYKQRQKDIHKISMGKPEIRKTLSVKTKDLWDRKDSPFLKDSYKEKKRLEAQTKFEKTGISPVSHKKMNNLEEKVSSIISKFCDNFKFVGDGTVWIDGKNPDFINYELKKIIEVFGEHWHSQKITGKNNQEHEYERINHFVKNNYQCLVIWEYELENKTNIELKVEKFIKEI